MNRYFTSRLFRNFIFLNFFAFLPNLMGTETVSLHPYTLTKIWNLPITNSMLTGWIVSVGLIMLVQFIIKGQPKLIPSKGQLVLETLLSGLKNILEPITGKNILPHAFPLLIGLFCFILIHNWSGLIPGVGTIGIIDQTGHLLYFFRPSNSDLNTTLSISIICMLAWAYLVLRFEGIKSFTSHLFGNKANRKEVPFLIYAFLFFIFILVGAIECVSILFRLVSLSFRLYGNVFGGESLLTAMQGLCKYILPVPFYFLEVLIGAIQAFVFTLLVAVYIGLVCNHEEAH